MSASALLAGGIIAHHLAGSTVPTYASILGFLLLIFVLTLFLLDEDIKEEKLFIAIFLAQNGSHFLMGGKSDNSTVMFISHLFAGLASYLLIVRGSVLLQSIEYAFYKVATHFIPHFYAPLSYEARDFGWIPALHQISARQRLRYCALAFRAPPAA